MEAEKIIEVQAWRGGKSSNEHASLGVRFEYFTNVVLSDPVDRRKSMYMTAIRAVKRW